MFFRAVRAVGLVLVVMCAIKINAAVLADLPIDLHYGVMLGLGAGLMSAGRE